MPKRPRPAAAEAEVLLLKIGFVKGGRRVVVPFHSKTHATPENRQAGI
jgi:predicted RNA binding protein YcfA (HicA-like mRNA interferase family)